MALAAQKWITVEEFEAFLERPENAERNFELIHGEIVEKMPTQLHGRIVMRFGGHFFVYLEATPIGYVETEVRYRIPDDQHNSRQPDVSIVLDTVTPPVTRGAVLRMPDIIVEVKSPSDTYIAMRERAAYYLANGTRMVVLCLTEKHLLEVYRPDVDIDILTIDDTLDGGDLLPGFTLPVKDIFKS